MSHPPQGASFVSIRPGNMVTDPRRLTALNDIRQNIAEHGFHTYVVTGGPCPHYAYTIGLSQSLGAEVVMAGAYFYRLDEVADLIRSIVGRLRALVAWDSCRIELSPWGTFSLRKVHVSWATSLLLGALDFYQTKGIDGYQIVPDEAHWTNEIPDLNQPWSPKSAPAWRWLREDWTYPVPAKSVAITNLGALRGERITEAVRWEEDEWELLAGAGPDIPQEERRVVPLGVLLALDESLVPVVNLPSGEGLWRDALSDWHPWRQSQTT
jgi:hypothetical protein